MSISDPAMNSFQAIEVLNELLRVLCRSLPAYLADAKPWAQSEDRRLAAALDRLVVDQQHYARLVSDAITAEGGRPDPGQFPMRWTAKNDLSIEFLRQEVIGQLEQSIPVIEGCAAQLESVAAFHALAEEVLGNTRGHLDILREMRNEE